ncbi:hypothetical protein KAFR_0D01230 [Kazachstania africana CBS 2517]|uniref:Uncharacterized protein n=1 Tax=Kazachstania africana (strain ATCC 22294 / BCRC 22015 / CBS 2517 / CECT 1963 / NBRC 1671 / NRRL Y-8276) TaxID=1071382 RepID=H2ATR9_KAZAF|nr:hypothetical protein KAFR_0D01230 [Kazachstania africana CBS 2517]CCF57769.1 hypothetical protein KAFR_0D01230 [Kazachstania africana CBS 2517]
MAHTNHKSHNTKLHDEKELSSSVRDLLNDEMFNKGTHEANAIVSQLKFQECQALFIESSFVESLNKMHECGYLEKDLLSSNYDVFKLFVNNCENIEDFKMLGAELQIIASETFECEMMDLLPLQDSSSSLLLMKFLHCCSKTLHLDGTTKTEKSIELQSFVKNLINKNVRSSLNDNDFVYYMTSLYIFQIEIGLLSNKPTQDLYFALCNSIPNLSSSLLKMDIHGINAQQDILNKLDECQELRKDYHHRHSNHYHEKIQKRRNSTKLRSLPSKSMEEAELKRLKEENETYRNQTEESSHTTLTHVVSHWNAKLHQLLQQFPQFQEIRAVLDFLKKYRQHTYVLAFLLGIILINRKFGRIKGIIRYISRILKSLLPQLLQLLQTLTAV